MLHALKVSLALCFFTGKKQENACIILPGKAGFFPEPPSLREVAAEGRRKEFGCYFWRSGNAM